MSIDDNQGIYTKELIGLSIATLSLAGTIIGLVVDIPQISDSPMGKIFLVILFFVALLYLVRLIYTRFIREYIALKNRLNEIKSILVDFTSQNANTTINDTIDIDQIKLVSTTKWAKKLKINIQELQHLPNSKVKIVIDKGINDGLVDAMQFKVLHNSRYHELGACECTAFHNQTSLVIDISPNCPVSLSEINRDAVEVRLIDPVITNKVTLLIGGLLHKVDYG